MRAPLRFASILVAAVSLLGGGHSGAQDYPSRPIKLIVANSPGSPPDVVGRIVAAELAKALAQPVVVENKPGAGSIIGYEYVARQPSDGHTIAVVQVPSLAILPVTAKDLRFDPLKDLQPVMTLAEGRYALVTSSAQRWTDFKELAAFAKANPGKLHYGSSSPLVRLPMEALLRKLGVDVTYVPYSAAAPYYQGLITNEAQMGLVAESTAIAFREKLRVLALTGRQRTAGLPDVPTFAELGFPEIPGLSYSLNVTAGTPRSAIDKLHAAATRMLQDGEARSRFEKLQLETVGDTPDGAAKHLAEQAQFLAAVARQLGLRPE